MYEIRKENIGHFTSPEQVGKYKQALEAKSAIYAAARKLAAWDNQEGDYNTDAGTVVLYDRVERGRQQTETWNAALTFEPQQSTPPAPSEPPPPVTPPKKKWYSWIPIVGRKSRKSAEQAKTAAAAPPLPESAFKSLQATCRSTYSYNSKEYSLSIDNNGTRHYAYTVGRSTVRFDEDVSGNLFIQE